MLAVPSFDVARDDVLTDDAVAGRTRGGRVQPFHLLVPIAAFAALLLSIHSVVDPDVYWHVELGRAIIAHHSVYGAGSGWSLVHPTPGWTSPEWLAEVILGKGVAAMGWRAILVFQVVCSVAFLAVLARSLVRRPDTRAGALVYALVVVTLAPYLQARPQTLSLVMLAWLAPHTYRALVAGTLPKAWTFIPLVWLWAQIHGLWIVAPVAIAGAVTLRLLDSHDREHLQAVRRAWFLGLCSTVVGCVNPLGVKSLLLPLTLHSATSTINEWRPTTFTQFLTWGLLASVALLAVTWARGARQVPRAEIAWAGLLFGFALLAYRNVPVALILLSPLVVATISSERRVLTTEREHRRLLVAASALTGVAVAYAAVATAVVPPIPVDAPVTLARMLDDGQPHRVVNDYNAGGLLIAFAGPKVKVAADGRADYYGGPYLFSYSNMMNLQRGWQATFNSFHADSALLVEDGPLAQWLIDHQWVIRGRQGGYVLLRGPAR